MSRPTDPIQAARRRTVVIAALTAVAIAPAAWWALRPLDRPTISTPELAPPEVVVESAMLAAAPLPDGAFAAELWRNPPQPERPAPRASTPPPAPPARAPDVQLVGIVRETDPASGEIVLIAAIYDRAANELRLVRSGEMLAGHRLDVDERGVTLTAGAASHRLELRRERAL